MGLLDSVKAALGQKTVDLRKRFVFCGSQVRGSTGSFQVVEERQTKKKYGLKLVDAEKSSKLRDRFPAKEFPLESEIALAIKHENVVDTIEIGKSIDGKEFLLMEYLQGTSFERALVAKNPNLQKNRYEFIRQLALGVEAVHNAGFIHRDICPRNMIFDKPSKKVKLFDFGITLPNLPAFRQPRNRTGTPLYMAPEIVRRRPTDIRVDIFAFGITAFQICTLQHPWGVTENTSKSALIFDTTEPKDIRSLAPDLDEKMAAAIQTCIEIDPEKRCPNMRRFITSLGKRKS